MIELSLHHLEKTQISYIYLKKIIIKTPNGWYFKGGDLLLENQISQQQLTVDGYLVISI